MLEFISWWTWRRWRIYCPTYPVHHLFDQHRVIRWTPLGIMEFPSKESFQTSLFHYDEAFVSPCTFNEVWCGSSKGKWTPKIKFMSMEMPDDDGPTQDDSDGV